MWAEEIRGKKQMAQAGTGAELVPTAMPRDAHRIQEEWHRVQKAGGCSAILNTPILGLGTSTLTELLQLLCPDCFSLCLT